MRRRRRPTRDRRPGPGFTPALLRCARLFGLSPFERELLLLLPGLSWIAGCATAVAAMQRRLRRDASFAFALAHARRSRTGTRCRPRRRCATGRSSSRSRREHWRRRPCSSTNAPAFHHRGTRRRPAAARHRTASRRPDLARFDRTKQLAGVLRALCGNDEPTGRSSCCAAEPLRPGRAARRWR